VCHELRIYETQLTRFSRAPRNEAQKPHKTLKLGRVQRSGDLAASKYRLRRRPRTRHRTAQNREKFRFCASNSTGCALAKINQNRKNNSIPDVHCPHESGAIVCVRNAPSNRSPPVLEARLVEPRRKQCMRGGKHEKRTTGRHRRKASHAPLERA
jgi:hypothetical protein